MSSSDLILFLSSGIFVLAIILISISYLLSSMSSSEYPAYIILTVLMFSILLVLSISYQIIIISIDSFDLLQNDNALMVLGFPTNYTENIWFTLPGEIEVNYSVVGSGIRLVMASGVVLSIFKFIYSLFTKK